LRKVGGARPWCVHGAHGARIGRERTKMKSPVRVVGRKLRRYLTRHLAPGPNSFAMALDLGGMDGCSFVYCGHCERPMSGVVFAENQNAADIVALGCTGCGHRVPVRIGIVESCRAGSQVATLRKVG
jgi:hypothetical protein